MAKDRAQNKIGQKLKELRLAHGYTQSEVAMAADIKQQTYSAYESGKRIPSPVPIYKIANYYGISADDLLKLCLELDDNIYYEATPPTVAGVEMEDYLSFCNDSKYGSLTAEQKEMLYYFGKLDKSGRKDMIDYASYKLGRKLKGNRQ